MHDLRDIRRDVDAFKAKLARRGGDFSSDVDEIVALDEARVANTQAMNDAQAAQKQVSKRIGQAKAQGDEAGAEAAMNEVGALKARVQEAEARDRELTAVLRDKALALPNTLADDVPGGADESSNVEIRRWGTPRGIEAPKDHVDLGEGLGMMDFEAAAKLSGSRFVVLKRDLAKLERALATFMLNLHTEEFGYEEVAPPVVVNAEPLFGTGQLPKFEDDQFKVYKAEEGDRQYLSPTAEVTLTNLVREQILAEAELPKRMTAWTQCFRAEAGSAGRDTRGMIRLHQFSKVELVSITTPETSEEEHERMTSCAEEVLKRLGLPFRTMLLCSGDTGFGAAKTYDLEVWLPAQDTYREISSCSNTRGFQARRMDARYRPRSGDVPPAGKNAEKKPQHVHTLNGSGLAVGRTLVAVLENYQQPDGSIAVPDVLRPLMGKDRIEKAS